VNPGYPWRIGANGRTALEDGVNHLQAMIEQLLLTNAGERVNRPDFGGGLYRLVFAPNSPELAATLQLTLQANIQRYLADVVTVGGVTVQSIDDQLMIQVPFTSNGSAPAVAQIALPGAG
jgi:phage baseplate assembly protein W